MDTPKKKATDLTFKMQSYCVYNENGTATLKEMIIKSCYLANEIVEEIISDYKSYRVKHYLTLSQSLELIEFWNEVKDEISLIASFNKD